MKKFLFLTLLFTTVVETSNVNPTLTTLILKSSEILTDYEGSLQSYIKPLINEVPIIVHKLEPNQKYELFQIGINSFIVLGSPIEWEPYEGGIK